MRIKILYTSEDDSQNPSESEFNRVLERSGIYASQLEIIHDPDAKFTTAFVSDVKDVAAAAKLAGDIGLAWAFYIVGKMDPDELEEAAQRPVYA